MFQIKFRLIHFMTHLKLSLVRCMHGLVLALFAFQTDFAMGSVEFYNVQSQQHLCSVINKPGYFQQKLLFDKNSRLAFRNLPGPINRGICWWHSRMTMAANYLAIFRPDIQKKPTIKEVRQILKHLRNRDRIVEIPGYQNLYEFSKDNAILFEAELNLWSLIDSFTFKLTNGLIGSSKEDPQILSQNMDELYYLVNEEKQIVFQILQLPGLAVHSWLVVGMEINDQGYTLRVIDSNFLDVQKWNYYRGQSHLYYKFYDRLPIEGPFVPYFNTDWINEEKELMSVVRQHCSRMVLTEKQSY